MRGTSIIWVCTGMLTALVAVLLVPLRCRVRLRADAYGGACELVFSQAVWRKRIFYRFSLCAPPYFTLWRVRGDGTAGRARFLFASSGESVMPVSALLSAFQTEEIDLSCRIGLFGEPHVTALLCAVLDGAARAAAETLLPGVRRSIAWRPDFSNTLLRMDFDCIFRAVPAKIMCILIRKRRYAHATSH